MPANVLIDCLSEFCVSVKHEVSAVPAVAEILKSIPDYIRTLKFDSNTIDDLRCLCARVAAPGDIPRHP